MQYRTGFQCPETGLFVVANYAFGRVTIRVTEYEDYDVDLQTINDTIAYCKRYTNKRCRSIDEADEYIVRVSDGQTFGFDR